MCTFPFLKKKDYNIITHTEETCSLKRQSVECSLDRSWFFNGSREHWGKKYFSTELFTFKKYLTFRKNSLNNFFISHSLNFPKQTQPVKEINVPTLFLNYASRDEEMKSREEFWTRCGAESKYINSHLLHFFFALSRDLLRRNKNYTARSHHGEYMGCCWCGKVNENERFKQIAAKVFNGLFLMHRKA